MIDETLVRNLPVAPVSTRVGWRDRALAVGDGVGGIGNEFSVVFSGAAGKWRGERERAIGVQVEIDGLGLLGRPLRVSTPGVRSTLKSAGLPRRLLTFVVQVITEEGRFNVLAKLAGGLVPAERNDSDVVALGRAPFPVIPN